jgi:hypothetical protein
MVTRASFTASLVLLFAACAAPGYKPAVPASSELRIQFSPAPDGQKEPVGWIYAFARSGGREDLCVYVWPDSTWSLGAEKDPGYYGTLIARGQIVDGTAIGFPSGLIDDSTNLYVAGRVSAEYGGVPISGSR